MHKELTNELQDKELAVLKALNEELRALNKELKSKLALYQKSDNDSGQSLSSVEEVNQDIYFNIFNNTIDGVAIHNIISDDYNNPVDYITIEVNRAFETILSTSKEKVIGKRASEILPENELKEWLSLFSSVSLRGGNCSYENYSQSNDRYYEGNVFSSNKNQFVVVFRDVTDRKKAEKELFNAKHEAEELDRLKSTFLHNISHEIRTPLNAIVGFSNLIVDPLLSDEKRKAFTRIISQSSDKLLSKVSDVIEVSQIQSNQSEVDFGETEFVLLITNIVAGFTKNARAKGIDLLLYQNIPSIEYSLFTDGEKLKKILWHLLDNAIKFTFKGKVEVSCELKGNNVLIEVSDTGIGISQDLQEVIFEPFYQLESDTNRSYGGNGLGLTIVKAYVEFLNGTIKLTSEKDNGTKFTISLPTKKARLQSKNEGSKELPVLSGTILIAEDEYSNYEYLYELMSPHNFEILHASNGQEAIDLCKNNKKIDLVLMDIKMPVLDGYTAAKIIKVFRPRP